jgi:hypothetical protein
MAQTLRRLTADLSDPWQCEFDAEAARLEFEEGLPRLQAEELARQWITLRGGHVAGLCTRADNGVSGRKRTE